METSQKTYLCQVSEKVSCGACCGLYNVPDPSEEPLYALLHRRSLLFAGLPRTTEAIDAFGLGEAALLENRLRPRPEFHHCPFLGLVGKNSSRVGCLLHPQGSGNGGVDLRGLSWYGAFACRTYFCPAHNEMPDRYKEIVQAACRGWHLYGLVITEREMLENFFLAAEKLSGKTLDAGFVEASAPRLAAMERFLRLKESWPFRPEKSPRVCHYFFKDGLYPDAVIPYEALGAAPSPFDAVFRALGSVFASAGEVARAEALLTEILAALIS